MSIILLIEHEVYFKDARYIYSLYADSMANN